MCSRNNRCEELFLRNIAARLRFDVCWSVESIRVLMLAAQARRDALRERRRLLNERKVQELLAEREKASAFAGFRAVVWELGTRFLAAGGDNNAISAAQESRTKWEAFLERCARSAGRVDALRAHLEGKQTSAELSDAAEQEADGRTAGELWMRACVDAARDFNANLELAIQASEDREEPLAALSLEATGEPRNGRQSCEPAGRDVSAAVGCDPDADAGAESASAGCSVGELYSETYSATSESGELEWEDEVTADVGTQDHRAQMGNSFWDRPQPSAHTAEERELFRRQLEDSIANSERVMSRLSLQPFHVVEDRTESPSAVIRMPPSLSPFLSQASTHV